MSYEFSISFNPDTSTGPFGDSDGGAETALIFENYPHAKDGYLWNGRAFFILKGDFDAEYQKLIDDGASWSDLKNFYDANKREFGSRWSTDFHTWGKDGRRRKKKEPISA